MSWTIDDARDRAQVHLDEEIEDSDALIWGNDFLREKVDGRFYTRTTETYTSAVAGTRYDLPELFTSVIEVLDSDGEAYEGYSYDGESIEFDDDDTYTLTYRAIPDEAGLDDAIELPILWLSAMAYFIASRFRAMDDPEDQDALIKMTECDKIIKRALAVRRGSGSNSPIRIRMRW